MKTPVNGRTLRQHLTYSWWKYALVIIIGAFAVNMYFTVTVYRSPEEKKINLYVYGLADEARLSEYMESVRLSQMPDMEEMTCLILTTDETYGPMQLSTYIAAGEGDIYILPKNEFVSMASSGAWVPLDEASDLADFFTEHEISLQSGWKRNSETGVSHLYGIPVSRLPGLQKYVAVDGGYICVLVSNGNTENVVKFLKIFCEDMLKE